MGMALSLGRRGLGRVWPNPSVGCVIVRNGRVLGRGWTADGGRPHAETRALSECEAAGYDAAAATAYVTLEPCSHHGQTPPCTQALIAARVARVVIATGDPDPRVNGSGIAQLRNAGIAVTTGIREAEARADLGGFLLRVTQNRPFVTLKLATTFDGRIATATGESRWITGPEARRMVHALRAQHDGVMVGAGTVRADDPALTLRDLGIARQPVRIVVSRKLDFKGNRLAATLAQAPLWLCHGTDAKPSKVQAWQAKGAQMLACTQQNRQVCITDVLAQLASKGLTRVFCEGGGTLAASLLSAGLVDEVVGFTAGLTLGAEGTPAIGAMGIDGLAQAPRFTLLESRKIGADLMHRWRAAPVSSG